MNALPSTPSAPASATSPAPATSQSETPALSLAEASALVSELFIAALEHNATDVHIPKGGALFYRSKGVLNKSGNFGVTGKNGTVSESAFNALRTALCEGNTGNQTKVYRFRSLPDGAGKTYAMQCRVQPAHYQNRDSLALRMQFENPPDIATVLRGCPPSTLKILTEAQGLNLVVGPIGGGKTTFAAALARHWANQGRHILTMEDPVEYILNPTLGLISQQDVKLTGFSNGIALSDAIASALRADMDGLYLGEIRNDETLRAGLDFARTREPVVSTYHAGSIGDAVASLYNTSGVSWNIACSTIGSVLTSIIYINLAYTEKGVPVPVVMFLPFHDPVIRKTLFTGDQSKLGYLIDEACNGERQVEGKISRKDAVDRARMAGATSASIMKALPQVEAEEDRFRGDD
jgi:Tfp pilus assembly pilus retraction ATPase PilT